MSISKTFVAPQFVMVEDDGEVIVSDRALLNDVLNVSVCDSTGLHLLSLNISASNAQELLDGLNALIGKPVTWADLQVEP